MHTFYSIQTVSCGFFCLKRQASVERHLVNDALAYLPRHGNNTGASNLNEHCFFGSDAHESSCNLPGVCGSRVPQAWKACLVFFFVICFVSQIKCSHFFILSSVCFLFCIFFFVYHCVLQYMLECNLYMWSKPVFFLRKQCFSHFLSNTVCKGKYFFIFHVLIVFAHVCAFFMKVKLQERIEILRHFKKVLLFFFCVCETNVQKRSEKSTAILSVLITASGLQG